MKTAIIIPALNPDDKLLNLVKRLQRICGDAIIIVDDGSRNDCNNLFEKLEYTYHCIICHHTENLGKGASLKTGIRRAIQEYPELLGVVTADADGQHIPEDIMRLSKELQKSQNSLVLGMRNFSSKNVPLKSRWGNRITSLIFSLETKIRCPDTQTGLRGIPIELAKFCLSVPGNRFEYEMNVLSAIAKKGIPLKMMSISTVYQENNQSSHFHPVMDSLRIYFNILKFSISSLICAAIDLLVFTLLMFTLFNESSTGILEATIISRCISGVLNFTLNKRWCFACHGINIVQGVKYLILFCAQMLLSWAFVTLLSYLPVNLTLLKILADSMLFIFSYFIQRKLIFNNKLTAK